MFKNDIRQLAFGNEYSAVEIGRMSTPRRVSQLRPMRVSRRVVTYEAPFTNASVVVGMETVTLPGIARLAWKFLSLDITVGVTS
jgi:hypothetical protein